MLATDDKCQEQRWWPGVARPPADTGNHAAETEARLPLDILFHSLPNIGFQLVPPLGRTVASLQKVKDTIPLIQQPPPRGQGGTRRLFLAACPQWPKHRGHDINRRVVM